jgi:hypothetical protein
VFIYIKAIHQKVKSFLCIFFIDEVDTHELLSIEELANKFLWKITWVKFIEYAHACMYTKTCLDGILTHYVVDKLIALNSQS